MLKQLFSDCLKPAAWQFSYFSVHISSHLSHLLSTIKPLVTFDELQADALFSPHSAENQREK